MKYWMSLALLTACGGTSTEPAPAPEEPAGTEAPAEPAGDPMASALEHPGRSEDERARDAARHPTETLDFLGVDSDDRVIELWPGGGWYSHILAPYLQAGGGHLIVTHYTTDAEPAYRGRHATAWAEYVSTHGFADSTSTVTITDTVPDFSGVEPVDAVLTFRNVHNWVSADIDATLYQRSFDVLKPGGTFGVVEHRAAPGTTREHSADSGYMDQQAVIDAVTAVGFELVESSEVNANPLDTKDHPEGVWTLPPSFALDDVDREKYAAIGESDRMTLRFRKPSE